MACPDPEEVIIKPIFPGAIGYFQVDNKGIFSTPLLPGNNDKETPGDLTQRQAIHNQVYAILKENKLIQKAVLPVASNKSVTQSKLKDKKLGSSDADDVPRELGHRLI